MSRQRGEEVLPQETSSPLRIATWNLWWRYGAWQTRSAAILTTLKGIDADIVALNEVWELDGESQADELGAELGMHTLSKCLPASGNALLSRWPVLRSDILMLGETRCAVRRSRLSRRDPFGVRHPPHLET